MNMLCIFISTNYTHPFYLWRSEIASGKKCNYAQISSLLAYTPDIYIVLHQLIKTGKEREESMETPSGVYDTSKFIFPKDEFNQAAFRKSGLKFNLHFVLFANY